jgi:hypothetical protein
MIFYRRPLARTSRDPLASAGTGQVPSYSLLVLFKPAINALLI